MTNRASVKNLTATVKAMQLNNKQVTLSMFRQIDREPLFTDYDLLEIISKDSTSLDTAYIDNIIGKAWGRVNYCPDKSCSPGKHIHVVWSKDDKLYQCRVEEVTTFSDYMGSNHSRITTAWLVHSWLAKGEKFHGKYDVWEKKCYIYRPDRNGMVASGRIIKSDISPFESLGHFIRGRLYPSGNPAVSIDHLVTDAIKEGYTQAMAVQFEGAMYEYDAWSSAELEIYNRLSAMDLLFIAV